MEFILTIDRITRQIDTNIQFEKANGLSYFNEGYIYEDMAKIVNDEHCNYTNILGAYNLFTYRKGKYFRIINDRFAFLTLFYSVSNTTIVVSNNFWNLVKNVDIGEGQIDYSELRRFIFYTGSNPNFNTFIRGIYILPPATIFNYSFEDNLVSFDRYWSYSRTKEIKSIQVAADQAYDAIDRNFQNMARHFQNREFIFGNSGGLDSRLIPYFAKKHGLSITGFTVLQKRNRLGFKTATYASAEKIRKHYGFEQHYMARMPANFNERLLLDIRNAPATSCNILDSPWEHLSAFKHHILICGNPAYLIGHKAWTIPRSFENIPSWNYFVFYLLRMWGLDQIKLRDLSDCINVDEYLSTSEIYRPMFERYKSHGYVSLFQNLHHICMDLTAYSGAFESINRTKLSLHLYYPYLDICSCGWDDELLMNRTILKELNRRVNVKLADVHDQDFRYLDNPKSVNAWLLKIKGRFNLLSSGMDCSKEVEDHSYLQFAHGIMTRINPLFVPLGDSQRIMKKVVNSSVFWPRFSVNFIKVKKMLDMIYYGEFNMLERNDLKII